MTVVRWLVAAVTVAAVAGGTTGGAASPAVRLAPSVIAPVALGVLPGGTDARALGENGSGEVVGWSYTTSGGHSAVHAFSWTAAGGMVDLHSSVGLGGIDSSASEVSDNGEIVGWSFDPDSLVRAYAWTQAGGLVDLGHLPGGSQSRATRVNNGGEVVGWADTTGPLPGTSIGLRHAFLWTKAGGMVDLGTFGGSAATAGAVNDAGQVVGYSDTKKDVWHAFSWTQAGGMVDLGTLGGTTSVAHAVNQSGQAAGQSTTAAGAVHAFSWTQAGGMIDLGTLGGATSVARGVNDDGEVVGYSDTTGGAVHGFSWTKTGGMTDLGPLPGDVNSYAEAVNDSGQAVGWSEDAAGHTHAVLWRLPAIPAAPAPAPARISALHVRPAGFRAARRGPTILPQGTKGVHVQFDVSESTVVTFGIERAYPGRRRGARCLPDAPARRGLPRCRHWVELKVSYTRSWQAGRQGFRFTGYVNDAPLAPGAYRLVATAPKTADKKAVVLDAGFTIER